MESVDGSMLLTAFPAVAKALKVDTVDLRGAFGCYFLAAATCIPLSSWLADRLGTRTVFCCAVATFTIASLCCATATTLPEFVGARALQGGAGAFMFPVGRTIVLRAVTKSEFVGVFSNITIPATIGPMLGPFVGGFLTTYLDWRWMFWVNIPLGLACLILGSRCLPQFKGERSKFNFFDFFLSSAGVAVLGYGLFSVGRSEATISSAGLMIAVGSGLIAAYVARNRKRSFTVLDLGLLREPTFRCGIICGFVARATSSSAFFLLPILLQDEIGLTPLETGSLLFASAGGFFATKFIIKAVLRVFGFRATLTLNTFLIGFSIISLVYIQPTTSHLLFLTALFASGLFRCIQFMAADLVSYVHLSASSMARGATVGSVSKQLAPAAGVAYAMLLLSATQQLSSVQTPNILLYKMTFSLIALTMVASALSSVRLSSSEGHEIAASKP